MPERKTVERAKRELRHGRAPRTAAGAASIIAAVAVAPPQVRARLHAGADHAVSALSPQHIYSVQAWYADFSPPTAEDIRELLVAAAQHLVRARGRNFLSQDVDT
jgi:predicted phosphoribosyltransferase